MKFRAGQKTRIRRTEPNPVQKSSNKPEPKLIKYPNRFKILVSKEPKPNPTRTKISQIPECNRNTFIFLNILLIFRFNIY